MEAVRDLISEARKVLVDLYGERLAKIVLFGSQVRGEAHDESDIDLMVVLKGKVDPVTEVRRTSDIVLYATLEHGMALSIVHLPFSSFEHPDHPLMINVRKEGVAL